MSSHRQIFKSTALIGGAQVINILIGILRTKALALLLGPSGTGLTGLYFSATGVIGSLTGFGIGTAGVRQIAEAAGSHDEARIARTIVTLRRVSWFSGALGMALVLIMAKPLSVATFGNDHYVGGVALISLTLLFGNISAGQMALLQGLRRLKDLAACSILGALFGTVASVTVVYFLRERGVALFLVVVAGFGIFTSWWYARKVEIQRVNLTWRETLHESRMLLGMGAAFMMTGLIGSGVTYCIRTMIVRNLGMGAVGLYFAATTLSSIYVGVVLNAMGADFYPRLTSIANDNKAVNQLVNEQSEVGLLIALPGILVTLVLAPWVLKIFYTADFMPATDLIRWQILGVGLRVICWPLGYIILAKGMGKLMVLIESIMSVFEVGLIFVFMKFKGLEGCGIGFVIFLAIALATTLIVSYLVTGFKWSGALFRLILFSIAVTGFAFLVVRLASPIMGLLVGSVIAVLASAYCAVHLKRALHFDVVGMLRQRIINGWKAITNRSSQRNDE